MKKMKKVKKVVALMLALVLVASSLTGCKSDKKTTNTSTKQSEDKSGDTDKSKEPVNIEILQYKVEINDQLQAAIDTYTKENPNVKITLQTIGGGEDIGVTYKSRAAAGDMPDIFNCIGPDECGRYKDFLEDLSDQPWVSHANAGMLDLDTIDGKVYGLPVSTEAFGLIANKKMFEDAGVDISNITTYDQLDQAFAALQAKIDDGSLADKWPMLKNVTAVQGAEKWVLGDHAVNVALAPEFKEDVFAAYNAKDIQFSYKDAYKDYIDLQLKYSANAKDHAGAVSVGYSDAVQGALALGSVAVIQQGNWIYNDVNTVDPKIAENLVFLPAPVKGYKEDSIFTLVANYWCVNSQSDAKVKQASKDFLNWLYQSDAGKDIVVNKFGFLPVFDNYGDLAPKDPLSKGILDYMKAGKVISAVFKGAPGADWLQQVFGSKVQGYLTGDLTWDQVFDESAKEWNSMRNK
ncbi:ABC transporter substrate-binding protein [Anaeromicropila herbilytica]|uniref:ABC transporter substrate-binding protein n=1 Tax=Anaeromicropila herbilytica TaxID=2785025 RepID=A0A7R7EKT6_9FIRM|nr:ABC transporter substrate-binding protein [Anaeromicropila herbilytica]BCN30609.1 ABC transporter substrate-binding protein [Anaeromicropila herbilytica]